MEGSPPSVIIRDRDFGWVWGNGTLPHSNVNHTAKAHGALVGVAQVVRCACIFVWPLFYITSHPSHRLKKFPL